MLDIDRSVETAVTPGRFGGVLAGVNLGSDFPELSTDRIPLAQAHGEAATAQGTAFTRQASHLTRRELVLLAMVRGVEGPGAATLN